MPTWHMILLFTFILGAVVGSFANVLIYRLPRRESIVSPGSHCPGCGKPIRWFDNIPLISYLILRGRCRSCGEIIPWRYPAVEMVNGLLYLGLAMRFGAGTAALVLAPFVTALLVITFIDMDHRIIPNVISYPGMAAGLGLSFLAGFPRPLDSVIGLLVGGGFLYLVATGYYLITKREGMGMGDVKLLGMIGAYLGWQALPVTILLAAVTGSVIGLVAMRVQSEDRTYAVPFGPFLALGALAHIFFGKELILWYLGRII